ncbi:MAG: riboflavin synthase, partial [Actinomycetota bacterium]
MFTGIVEELGKVVEMAGSRMRISAETVLDGSKIGSSIAVNGCCLTVVALDQGSWSTDVSQETFSRTNLGSLRVGDPVNLERPMALGDRLGGHLVLG